MKQILLSLLALLGVSTMTMATDNVAYNFDDEAFAELQNSGSGYTFTTSDEAKTVGGIEFIDGGAGKLAFQANDYSVMVGEDENSDPITISPSYRVNLGGSGSTSKVAISIPIEGSCTLYVVAASGGDEVRYLVVHDGNSQVNTTDNGGSTDGSKTGFAVPKKGDISTSNCLFSCVYNGTSNVLYLYSAGSGINVFYIYVSYDDSAPEFPSTADDDTEDGENEDTWTLTDHTKVGYESISWDELEGYDAIKFVLYYDGDHTGWGMGGIYTFEDGNNAVYGWTGTYDVDEFIITVDDLVGLVGGTEAGGFAYNTWSPCVNIEVYFGVGDFITGIYEGTSSSAIANIKSDAEVTEVARYNLIGQKLSGAEKGINIIVYSDGSSKKVLVK